MNEDNLEQLAGHTWEFITKQSETHSALAVAGVMVTQALSIYRSLLSPEEYDRIVDTVSDTRGQIHKFSLPNLQ
jgi:hypothetical protein